MSAETVSAITDRGAGRARAVALAPAGARVRVHVRRLPLRAGEARARRAQHGGPRDSRLRPAGGAGRARALWMQETEGAHHWMGVFDELRQRGVEDVLFVSMDGVSGLADGLRAIFPDAVAQRCLVHLVRATPAVRPVHDTQAFCRDARAFYGAPSLSACRAAFADFSRRARYPGAVATWGALDGRGRAAVPRPRRQEGHVHHQRSRERERQLPQGRQAGCFPTRTP